MQFSSKLVLAIAGFFLAVQTSLAFAQEAIEFQSPSQYWCTSIRGSVVGSRGSEVLCRAAYERQANACALYREYDDGDAQFRSALAQVQATPVCTSDTVREAKRMTLRYRVELRRYMTAGGNEDANDPVFNKSFRPRKGETGGRAVQFLAYALHQCIVETCEAK